MAWTPPVYNDFVTRFPEFKGYDQALVEMILADSNARVAEGAWTDHDKSAASMNLTAHRLLMTPGAAPTYDEGGDGVPPTTGGVAIGAVKSRTVGDVRVEYETGSAKASGITGSGGAAAAGPLGEFYATTYGRHYLYLMKLNFPAVAVVYR
jgi:hypothetical protein